MRLEKKELFLLISGTLLALAGLGPDDPWIVGPCLLLSWAAFIWLCLMHEGRRRTRAIAGVLITLVLFGVGYRRFHAIFHAPEKADSQASSKPPVDNPVAKEAPPPRTVRDVFDSDFPYLMRANMEAGLSIKEGKTKVPIARKIYQDFVGGNKFVGFYIPLVSQDDSFEACLELPKYVLVTFSGFEDSHDVSAGPMDQMTSEKDLRFSGRVMLYYEDFLSITQKAQIIEAFKREKYDVQLRGPDYLKDTVVAWHQEHDKKN